MRPAKHHPTKPHCFLTQRASNPEASRTNVSEETPCTWQPWLACTEPSPPQESLVRNETRISLPSNPSLTRTTLCQLCVVPRTSRSRPVTTEPGREPRVSDGTAGTAVQCPWATWEAQEQILIYNDGLPRANPHDTGSIVHHPMGLPSHVRL